MIIKLFNWYIEIFSCRISVPREYEKEYKCYIFCNEEDLEMYCREKGIKYISGKYVYNDYVLINEENVANLVGLRITKVYLISSKVPLLVKEICTKRIEEEHKIEFQEMS